MLLYDSCHDNPGVSGIASARHLRLSGSGSLILELATELPENKGTGIESAPNRPVETIHSQFPVFPTDYTESSDGHYAGLTMSDILHAACQRAAFFVVVVLHGSNARCLLSLPVLR